MSKSRVEDWSLVLTAAATVAAAIAAGISAYADWQMMKIAKRLETAKKAKEKPPDKRKPRKSKR